jgi:hypothetical protein
VPVLPGGRFHRGIRRRRDPPSAGQVPYAATMPPLDVFPHNQSHSRAALASSFNGYKAGFFERAQRPAFRIRLDTPFLQHQVGNEEAVVTPQPLEVPQCQSD